MFLKIIVTLCAIAQMYTHLADTERYIINQIRFDWYKCSLAPSRSLQCSDTLTLAGIRSS